MLKHSPLAAKHEKKQMGLSDKQLTNYIKTLKIVG
jgi:hypothetical protein